MDLPDDLPSPAAIQNYPVPETASHKRLKLQFNEIFISNKINSINDIPQTIHNKCENKSVTSNGSRSRGETKFVIFDDDEEPVTSIQQRLNVLGTPPQIIDPTDPQHFSMRYPSSLQHYSTGGRGRRAYVRYGGGRGRGRSLGKRSYSTT